MRSADEICKDAVQLHEGVVAAAILESGSLRGVHVKTEGLAPRLHRLETLTSQAELLFGSLKAGADYYGQTHYLMSHGDKVDVFLFPVWLNGRQMIFVLEAAPPYSHEELSARLRRYIGETMSASRQ